MESKTSSEHRILKAYHDFLRQSVENEFQAERSEAQAELEAKRQELRTKLLNEWEEKKRQLEIERNQVNIVSFSLRFYNILFEKSCNSTTRVTFSTDFKMDLCGNWIDAFENKTKRRLRPRETKDDQKDEMNPCSSVSQIRHPAP